MREGPFPLSTDPASLFAALALGLAAGGAVAWVLSRRVAALERTVAARDEALAAAAERLRAETAARAALAARLEEQQRSLQAERALLEEAEVRLADTFKALSSDALQAQGASFLQLARQVLEKHEEGARGDLERRQQAIGALVVPVREALGRFEAHVAEIEQRRTGAYAELREQVRSLGEAQEPL